MTIYIKPRNMSPLLLSPHHITFSMFDDYQSHRYPAFPSSASSSTASSSSSSSSGRLSLKNFHVGRRAALATTTTAAEIDIAHILDPAYYSPKHHSTAFMSSNQVYIDTTGETHDPEYRLFASSATHSPKRREFLSILSNTNNDDGDDEDNSYYNHYNSSFWGDEDKENRRYRQRSSFDSYRSPSRASDPIYTYSNYQHFDQSYAYRPTNDWQEEPDVFSLEEEEERQPRSQTRSRRESNKLRRRRAESESEGVEEFHVDELWKDDERVDCDMRETVDEELEKKGRQARSMSPLSGSTTQSFRRQWLALRLRTQFAAFRARRKMTTLVKCATAAA